MDEVSADIARHPPQLPGAGRVNAPPEGVSATNSGDLVLPAAGGKISVNFRTDPPPLQSVRTKHILAGMAKAPNQTFIARQLNLAPGTVSRALRQEPGIKPETRERVLKLAQQLGYTLRRRSKNGGEAAACYLGVLVQAPESNWTHTRYLVGLSEAAAAMNVTLIVHHVSFQDCLSILHADRQPPAMRDGRVKGICLVHRWPEDVAKRLSEQFAAVSVVHFYPDTGIDLIDMDHRSGMNLLAEHLYALGHRRIGYFGYCGEISWSRARYAGYVEAMTRLGLRLNPAWTVDLTAESFDQHVVAAEVGSQAAALMRQGVTAWMAANEWSGQALTEIARQAGLRVPEDISITGFDSSDTQPRTFIELTSVGVSLSLIGAAALQRLNHRLTNPSEPRRNILFDVSLVEGKSTAPVNPRLKSLPG